MPKISDDFLQAKEFDDLRNHCLSTDFKIINVGNKKYSIINTPIWLLKHLAIPDHELILTFIRSAYLGFNDEINIHADNIIEGKKTALASVLYISTSSETSVNGTAFWEHHEHGIKLPEDVTNQEFDRLLTEDSNDLSKWELKDIVWSKPNRQVVYPSNNFHSKWPQEITVGKRIVLVSFYSKK